MRVHVVDPSAYTPPYDHALCSALAEAGADVELYTSRFAYGSLAPPTGYRRREFFYQGAARAAGRAHGSPAGYRPRTRARRALKLAEHVPDMLRYRRAARGAELVHFQWLTLQHLDGHLLPARRASSGRRLPLVLTAHDVLPREPHLGQRRAQRRLFGHFDAIVVHSEHGRRRLTGELGLDPAVIHLIPHGALTHLAQGEPAEVPLQADGRVVLFFGLLRPYKGLDVLLEAWRGIEGAELWVVGMPRMDLSALRAAAPANVRFDPRFTSEAELRSYFRRADLIVLPYREIDQSGVLFTALPFAKPLLLSDVGAFGELAATGAARTVPAGDATALREALRELLDDPAALAAMGERARAAAEGPYAWDQIARRTLELYRSLLGENPPR